MSVYNNRLERAADRRLLERSLGLEAYNETPLLDALLAKKEMLEYGRILEKAIVSTPVDRSQWFANGFGANSFWQPSSDDQSNNYAMWQLAWKDLFTPTVINEIEAKKAKGGPLPYLDIQLELPANDHRQKVARSAVYGDGTNNDLVGIMTALSETGTGTYGGLTRKYFPSNLIAHIIDGSDVAAATTSVSSINSFESSNVLTVSGDQTASITVGKDVVLTKSGSPTVIATVIARDYNTTSTGNTTIFVDRVLPKTVTGYTGVFRSKLYSAGRFGGASKFSLAKLNNGMQRCKGKVKVLLTEEWGFGHILDANRGNELSMTEEMRGKTGFKGYHKAAMHNGVPAFLDATLPSGEFIGTDFESWKLVYLQDYDDMKLRRAEGIQNLVSGGRYAVGATGYILINVFALGTWKLGEMFRLHTITDN